MHVEHDLRNFIGSVDLGPVPRDKRVEGDVLRLRLNVFCNAQVKIRVCTAPDEMNRNFGAPEVD